MKKIRVAIVDDNAVIRSSVRRVLSGHHQIELVGEATNGAEALLLVEKNRLDVLVLDMEMPVMNGVDVLITLQKKGMPVKVVVLSVYNDDLFVQSILEHGAVDYVTKEEGPRRILSAILKAGMSALAAKQIENGRSLVSE